MALRAQRTDQGAVAVVVSLVVTLVLIPVAALAVDLGSSYTLAAAAQRAADSAALAGAGELAHQQRWGATPATAIQAAVTAVIGVLCHDPALNPPPPAPPGSWHEACAAPGHGWALDRDSSPADASARPNGEIEFFTGAPSASAGAFSAGQRTDGGTNVLVSGIRVVTPPARVSYGFASLFGRPAGTVQRAATAQLRSVLPARDYNWETSPSANTQLHRANTRLYLTEADLVPQAAGRPTAWCARSGPRESWRIRSSLESGHPAGVCDPAVYPAVPRGLLAAGAATSPLTPGLTSVLPLEAQMRPAVSRMRELTPALFGSAGRLTRPGCPGGNTASTGGYPGIESGYLSGLVNPRVGPASGLKSLVLGGSAPGPDQEGWLSPGILGCGRLALVPVLDGVPAPPLAGLGTGPYPVGAVRLVWLDNVFSEGDPAPIATAATTDGRSCLQRGFYWENASRTGYCPARDETNAPLRAITGYILDPRLLPATVSGPAAVNAVQYLGSGLPVTVRLIRDLSDPPAT